MVRGKSGYSCAIMNETAVPSKMLELYNVLLFFFSHYKSSYARERSVDLFFNQTLLDGNGEQAAPAKGCLKANNGLYAAGISQFSIVWRMAEKTTLS